MVGLDEGLGEFIHHHAAVFPVGNLGNERRNGAAAQGHRAPPEGFVTGLHLAHQLGVGALGFDQRGDADALAAGVARHQLAGAVLLVVPQAAAIGVFNAVFLHQKPAVAALFEGLDEGIERVGMVGQVHLRWGEALHPLQGLRAKQGCEMVLPSQDLQLQIGDRRGGRHGVAPERSQPLHMGLQAGITGELLEGLEDVEAAHLPKAPEQIAGVIEHDPRIAAALNQLRNDVGEALVALGKGLGVVVIALTWVLHHVLQMGDQFSLGASWNRGLVHVQGTGEARADLLQLEIGVGQKHRLVLLHQGQDLGFAAGNGWQGWLVHH